MDEKRAGFSLRAPGSSGGSLRLPGRGGFPPVDEHLVVPEVTRDEIIRGRRVVAQAALAPHADKQVSLGTLLEMHVAPGYVVSADLLTRFSVDSDFASDVCVRRDGADPATGDRYLEEIAFEVVSTQAEGKASEKAGVMLGRGVRRVFGIWVKKGRRRVCEWVSGGWLLLDEASHIEDPCLATPLLVKALLDAALVRRAVVQALDAQNEPAILELKAAAKAEGKAEAVLDILAARGVAVSPPEREEILRCTDLDRLDRWIHRAAFAETAAEVLGEE